MLIITTSVLIVGIHPSLGMVFSVLINVHSFLFGYLCCRFWAFNTYDNLCLLLSQEMQFWLTIEDVLLQYLESSVHLQHTCFLKVRMSNTCGLGQVFDGLGHLVLMVKCHFLDGFWSSCNSGLVILVWWSWSSG